MRSRCFCILGVDILVDVKLKPWLLEINHLPSFTTDSDLDYDIKKRLVQQSLELLPILPVKLAKRMFGHEHFDELWMDKKKRWDENLIDFEKAYPLPEEPVKWEGEQ